MTRSPCLECDHKDEDKDLFRHINCEKRLTYAVSQGMLPEELLNKNEEQHNMEDKPKCPCKPDCDKPIKARGLCDSGYAKWKRKNPGKVRHYSKVANGEKVEYFDVRLQAHVKAHADKYKLLETTAKIARLEFRTIQNQLYLWTQEGIERWEQEKGDYS